MTNKNTAPTGISPEDAKFLAKQVSDWRREVARLQDLIAHATGAAAPAGIDLDKPLTGEDLMRVVFKRPDLSEAAREAEISYVMRGSGEIIVCGGDFDAMAEYANRHAGLSQFSNGEDAGQPAPTDEKVAEACFAVSPDDFKEEDGWVDYLHYDGAVVRAFLAANPVAVAPSDATGKADAASAGKLPPLPTFMRAHIERAIIEAEQPRGMSVHDGMARLNVGYLKRVYGLADAALQMRSPATSAAGRVALPTNADDAQAMALLGVKYLEQHAPDRLKATSAADAQDAGRPIPDAECAQGSCARGKGGCRGRCTLSGHKLPIVADVDVAAMAASRKDGDGSKTQRAPVSAPKPDAHQSGIAAAANAAGQVPDGWKLVPVEPTVEMRNACYEEYHKSGATYTSMCRAIVAAAPDRTPAADAGGRND